MNFVRSVYRITKTRHERKVITFDLSVPESDWAGLVGLKEKRKRRKKAKAARKARKAQR